MTTRRPRWRAYLLLARVSNLPTVWTNVLAGTVVAGTHPALQAYLGVALAVSLLYTAGMFLNDAFDYRVDARARPERPLPAGDVEPPEVWAWGVTLLAAGVCLAAWVHLATLPWSLALGAAIVYYDYRHKRDRFGPVVMGLCRALIFPLAAAAVGGRSPAVWIAAVVMWVYVSGLTLASKRLGPAARTVVPRLLAGISLVDALIILPFAPTLAPVAAAAFVLTLLAQRWVPGD